MLVLLRQMTAARRLLSFYSKEKWDSGAAFKACVLFCALDVCKILAALPVPWLPKPIPRPYS